MNLFSGKELALRIYGVNRNGKSDPAILEGFSLKVAELQIGKQARAMVMKMSDDRLISSKKFT